MFGRIRSKKKTDEGAVPVYLNVYDMTSINGYASWAGLGFYHSGVEVHGVEYSYGAHDFSSTGIFDGEPKKFTAFTFKKAILIGRTNMGPGDVIALMKELARAYRGNAYNLLTKNCNHFCTDVCFRLTGCSIPKWVNRLARIGLHFRCVLPVSLNSTRVQQDRIEYGPFDSLGLSLSPPSPPRSRSGFQVRGRSRRRTQKTRRTRSPLSPILVSAKSRGVRGLVNCG